LSQKLDADTKSLQELYTSHASLLEQRQANKAERTKTGNNFLDLRRKKTPNGSGELEQKFEELKRAADRLEAQIEALDQLINKAETELHKLLPMACYAFQRLYAEVRAYAVDSALEQLKAIVHPSFVGNFEQSLSEIALASRRYVDLVPMEPGQVAFFASRPLDNPLTPPADLLKERQATMKACVERVGTLKASVDGLFLEIQTMADFKAPPFFLGEEPQPAASSQQSASFMESQYAYETERRRMDQQIGEQSPRERILAQANLREDQLSEPQKKMLEELIARENQENIERQNYLRGEFIGDLSAASN
jgi:hypothetical protein